MPEIKVTNLPDGRRIFTVELPENLSIFEKSKLIGDFSTEIYTKSEPVDNKIFITAILDRSGSMQSIINDSIGGINSFIDEQRKATDLGEAFVTVKLFDYEHTELYNSTPIADVKTITNEHYVPRGATALYDAIGKTILELKAKGNKNNIIAILTDGEENASAEFNSTNIKKLITEAEDAGWKFIYLGANQDAFAVSSSLGITRGHVSNFVASAAGTTTAYADMSNFTKSLRSTMVQPK